MRISDWSSDVGSSDLTGEPSAGLDGLQKKGALPWPNPQNVNSFEDVFNVAMPAPATSPQVDFALFSNEELSSADAKPTVSMPRDAARVPQTESKLSAPVNDISNAQHPAPVLESTEERRGGQARFRKCRARGAPND